MRLMKDATKGLNAVGLGPVVFGGVHVLVPLRRARDGLLEVAS